MRLAAPNRDAGLESTTASEGISGAQELDGHLSHRLSLRHDVLSGANPPDADEHFRLERGSSLRSENWGGSSENWGGSRPSIFGGLAAGRQAGRARPEVSS